ncbi:hypothetical protein UY3_03831 [Chelonia mydas]|uniref:Uncharacterized protein n=1 Tax=Chelonia mydas TaxID=8469 RepID=M7CDW3_CHEMY|nr:hypothetical protein UY3_03831 [Chelonia mydas]
MDFFAAAAIRRQLESSQSRGSKSAATLFFRRQFGTLLGAAKSVEPALPLPCLLSELYLLQLLQKERKCRSYYTSSSPVEQPLHYKDPLMVSHTSFSAALHQHCKVASAQTRIWTKKFGDHMAI